MNGPKDFYKISDLSKEFQDSMTALEKEQDIPAQTRIQAWQACFMLAIAQQLSVIASHLGKIVRKAEDKTHDEN